MSKWLYLKPLISILHTKICNKFFTKSYTLHAKHNWTGFSKLNNYVYFEYFSNSAGGNG